MHGVNQYGLGGSVHDDGIVSVALIFVECTNSAQMACHQ